MVNPTITLIIPTISRPSLARALLSVRDQWWLPGDEILLVGDGPQPVARSLWDQFRLPGRYLEVPRTSPADWGHTPRNLAIPQARGAYLMALDDDDRLTPGAVGMIRSALADAPGRPHMFRMRHCHEGGRLIWDTEDVRLGNVGTPMFVTPNDPAKLGRYTPRVGGDHDFAASTLALYPPDALVWRPEVICDVRPSSD